MKPHGTQSGYGRAVPKMRMGKKTGRRGVRREPWQIASTGLRRQDAGEPTAGGGFPGCPAHGRASLVVGPMRQPTPVAMDIWVM